MKSRYAHRGTPDPRMSVSRCRGWPAQASCKLPAFMTAWEDGWNIHEEAESSSETRMYLRPSMSPSPKQTVYCRRDCEEVRPPTSQGGQGACVQCPSHTS
jgi:hypothetical protein